MPVAVSRRMLADLSALWRRFPQLLPSLKLSCLRQVDLILLEAEDEEWWPLRTSQPTLSRELRLSRWLWQPSAGMEMGFVFLAHIKRVPKWVIHWLTFEVMNRICAFWEAAFPACSSVTEGSMVFSRLLWSWEVLMITLENDRIYTLEQAASSRQE